MNRQVGNAIPDRGVDWYSCHVRRSAFESLGVRGGSTPPRLSLCVVDVLVVVSFARTTRAEVAPFVTGRSLAERNCIDSAGLNSQPSGLSNPKPNGVQASAEGPRETGRGGLVVFSGRGHQWSEVYLAVGVDDLEAAEDRLFRC